LRSYPADGCVLMGGCDKTTPALVMGALSMNLPTLFIPAGPMLRGDYRGKQLGSGSDTWKYWAELRAGNITEDDWREIEDGSARARRLDECDRPLDRDGAPRRRRARSRPVRRARAADAGDREHSPVGEVPDGGLLLCGRPARTDVAADRSARPVGGDRQRP